MTVVPLARADDPGAEELNPELGLVLGAGAGGSFLGGTMLFRGQLPPVTGPAPSISYEGLGAGYAGSAVAGVVWHRWRFLLEGEGAYFPQPSPALFKNGSTGSLGASVGLSFGPPRVSFYAGLGFGYRWTPFNFYINCTAPLECVDYFRIESIQWTATAALDLRVAPTVHILLPIVRLALPFAVRERRMSYADDHEETVNDGLSHPRFHAFLWVGTEVRFEIPLGARRASQ